MADVTEADYVVVGSGAGGGPLAARLALEGFEVVVLEAGGRYAGPNYDVPAFHGQATQTPAMQWDFFVQHYARPERQTNTYDDKYDEANGGVLYPRASTVGGCTAHNAMITVYPHDSDWDGIAALTGDPSWAADRMRPYFQRLENCQYVSRPLLPLHNPSGHGHAGWLGTQTADPKLAVRDTQVLAIALSAAANELASQLAAEGGGALAVLNRIFRTDPLDLAAALARHPADPLAALREVLLRHADPNDARIAGGSREGVFAVPLATLNGRRNGSREFLDDTKAKHPDRLTIVTDTLATRVLFDANNAATGVEYVTGSQLYRAAPGHATATPSAPKQVQARREVILAGGTFNTPQLLMLSGVGPAAELARHGVPVRADRPGVGGNLQDRYEVGVIYETERDLSLLGDSNFREPAAGERDRYYDQWQRDRTGPYATNGAVLSVVRRSRPDLPDPDLFIFALPGQFRGYFVHYADKLLETRNRFTWAVLKGHTHNTAGRVSLRSADPRDVPAIDFNYFDDGTPDGGADLDAVVEGVKFVRRVMGEMSAAGAVTRAEAIPGAAEDTDAKLREFVKRKAWGHHACGTCRMGRADDPAAVVDSAFRVIGTTNLRVVDASVFPRIPGFFIVTPVYMVAEKASDMIVATARATA